MIKIIHFTFCKSCFVLFAISLIISSCRQKEGDQEFEAYRYDYNIEELQAKFSDSIMDLAEREMQELQRVNEKGRYKADMASLDEHPVPEWYKDAKLCLFYDWGLYSVAGYGEKGWSRARYPDWYLNHMYHNLAGYHEKHWGNEFERDDFIPLFTAENFDAGEVTRLVKMSGARYIVPFSKHHDGYCLWSSSFTHRDVKNMMPGRDLMAELMEECRKEGIPVGFYFSVEEYEYPLIGEDGDLYIRYWSDDMAPDNAGAVVEAGEYKGEFVSEKHNRMISGKIPVRDFIGDYTVPQAKEFIDKYDPDILWFDGEWQRPAEYYMTPEIVAYFYNKADGNKEVVANDRMGMGTREKHGDFYTSETDEVVERMEYPWEENRSMSESYGWNRYDSLENYLTGDELVEMFVRIVAKGGNLNLMVNPDGTGKVSDIQKDLLRDLGTWLRVNGEAVYGSRPYEKTADNTQLGQPVWYTMSKDSSYAYAIVFDWPKSETFILAAANPVWDSEVYMLGYDKPLEWVDTGRELWGMSVKVPPEMLRDPSERPCEHAWVIKFRYDKNNEYGK